MIVDEQLKASDPRCEVAAMEDAARVFSEDKKRFCALTMRLDRLREVVELVYEQSGRIAEGIPGGRTAALPNRADVVEKDEIGQLIAFLQVVYAKSTRAGA
jgi:hypothetical protein